MKEDISHLTFTIIMLLITCYIPELEGKGMKGCVTIKMVIVIMVTMVVVMMVVMVDNGDSGGNGW